MKKEGNISRKVKLWFSFPNVWVSVCIGIFAVASIIASKYLLLEGNTFESSVFSNIFAGLLTGFVISLLSGVKAVYSSYLEARYEWLNETHKMILDFLTWHHRLFESIKLPYEEFFDLAYDTLARANWVNERIMQGTFDKAKWLDPPKYFLDKYGYDYLAVAEQISNFKEQIYNFGEAIETRKEEVDKFSPIEKVMFQLNCSVLDDMELIKIKITSSKKSII